MSQRGSASGAVPQSLPKGMSTQVVFKRQNCDSYKAKHAEPKKPSGDYADRLLSGQCSSLVLKVIPLNTRPVKAIAFKGKKICLLSDCIKP